MTVWGAEKSQQCRKYFLRYTTFASERGAQVRTWGRQTCFLPRAPYDLVTPLATRVISSVSNGRFGRCWTTVTVLNDVSRFYWSGHDRQCVRFSNQQFALPCNRQLIRSLHTEKRTSVQWKMLMKRALHLDDVAKNRVHADKWVTDRASFISFLHCNCRCSCRFEQRSITLTPQCQATQPLPHSGKIFQPGFGWLGHQGRNGSDGKLSENTVLRRISC